MQLNTAHPWHGVSPGPNPPLLVHGMLEISQGSRAKYEVDKETGLLRLDRVLFSAMHYPANYGFIPQTLGDDDDPLDILVLCQQPLLPLTLVNARVIGVMKMLDQGKLDEKIIAVAQDDVAYAHVKTTADLNPHFQLELRNFFDEYKKLENKEVITEDFLDANSAGAIISEAIARYQKVYGAEREAALQQQHA